MNFDMQRAMDAISASNRRKWDAEEAQIQAVTGNLASNFVGKIIRMVAEFEENLKPDEEIGVKLVSFGQTVIVHVSAIGYSDPSLVRFIGALDDGSPVELIQHVSQINFLLMSVKALNPEAPKRRIGFIQE